MRASIIIASRDEGEQLMQTLASITRMSTHPDYELIVVDDGDGTDGALVADRSPHATVIASDARGVAASRNIGAQHATGDFLVFCDAHIFIRTPDWLEQMETCLLDQSIAGCAPVISVFGNEQGQRIYGSKLTSFTWESEHQAKKSDDPYDVCCLIGGCVCYRTEAFQALGGWNRYIVGWGVEDLELSVRAWLRGYRLQILPRAEVAHVFRSKFPYKVTFDEVHWNALSATYLNFSDAAFQTAKTSIEKQWDARKTAVLTTHVTHKLSPIRHQWRKLNKHDEKWLIRRHKLPIRP